jgi:hypothetical protein
MIALCADVEVAELKSAVAVCEEVVPEVDEVDVVVVRLPCRWSCKRTRGAMMMTEWRQSSWRRCQSRRSQGRRGHRRKTTMQSRQTWMER